MPQHPLITEQNGTLMEPLIEHQAAAMPQPQQPQEQALAPHNPEPQAVAGMPRLFVGQVPTDKAEQDLYPLFAPYGVIEKITMVRGPEGKSRGCAMVQFKRWAEAESAMDALNGTSPLEGGKGRPLVVHFANPRRTVGNQMSEPAIAPRKLFVGQIPKTAGEQDLLTVFSPLGEVESVNILKSKGLHAGCAFVQFRKWSSCEAAIEALHEQMVMPGCEHPLVVKFADAKRRDQEHLKRRDGPAQQDLFDLNAKQKQMMAMGMGMMGMSGLMGGHHHPMMGGMMGGESMMALPGMSMSMPGMGLAGSPSSVAPAMHLSLAGGSKMDGGLHSALDGSSRDSLLAEGMEGLSVNSSGLGLADGLHGTGIGGPGINGNGNMGGLPGMSMMGGMPGAEGLMGGMGSHMMLGPSSGAQRGKLGRGVNDPAAYAHKLFIGQIPFEANEQDLWALFAPAGDILELAILRSQGRSKGCAFLTYASRAQAMTAINAFNGRPAGPNKKLVVKFADQK